MTYTPTPGTHILAACEEAIALAQKHSTFIDFAFNGVDLRAGPTMGAAMLADAYWMHRRNVHTLTGQPTGLYWLLADSPDGRVVLLAHYDDRTNVVTLVDDGCASSPMGPTIRRFSFVSSRPVERPEPWPSAPVTP